MGWGGWGAGTWAEALARFLLRRRVFWSFWKDWLISLRAEFDSACPNGMFRRRLLIFASVSSIVSARRSPPWICTKAGPRLNQWCAGKALREVRNASSPSRRTFLHPPLLTPARVVSAAVYVSASNVSRIQNNWLRAKRASARHSSLNSRSSF